MRQWAEAAKTQRRVLGINETVSTSLMGCRAVPVRTGGKV